MSQRPIETPWGQSQNHSDYAVGIVFHSTASHGGFQLSQERQAELHEVEAFRVFGPNWLEEDCDAVLVALRWPGFATDEAISDAIATARQVASWEHSKAKWQPVVDWLDTKSLQGPYEHKNNQGNQILEFLDTMSLQERADRHHKNVKSLWERGSMSTTGKGGKWLVSFRRGETERRTVTMDYPEKRYYSDEELNCMFRNTKKGIVYGGAGYEIARGVEVVFIPASDKTCAIVAVGSAEHRADELQFIDGVLSQIGATPGMGWTARSSDWE